MASDSRARRHAKGETGAHPSDSSHTDRRRRGPGQPVTPARHLGAHHFAFYRGALEGLDLADLGERYLETGRDRRPPA